MKISKDYIKLIELKGYNTFTNKILKKQNVYF
jgi:hypothetical protein